MFHALHHTHVIALIAAGLDVVAISRRIGQARPMSRSAPMATLFRNTDAAAANAIEPTLRHGREG